MSLFSFFPLPKTWPLHPVAILTASMRRSVDRSAEHASILLTVCSASTPC
ncbi:hypothetical protein GQ607_012821 [Colletotrichum asianum]|uniref:Uncharacterized protein n=1 Tax=Colletotrichum asianum TaxID=702518 RepID=A0A8H3W816_9PEZI|nr:hypothetical protein GQ607_012821 [Colletotrichum asianum]